jgi:hypothetical protein
MVGTMIRGRLKLAWLLCITQGLLGVVLAYYEPLQFRKSIEEAKLNAGSEHIQLGLDFYERHWPPPAGIVLRGLNYPALVLSGAFDLFPNTPLYSSDLRQIYFKNLAFLGLIFVLWYWVGNVIDNRELQSAKVRRTTLLGVLVYGVGLVVSITGTALAVSRLIRGNGEPPERQLFSIGLVWSLLLLGYVMSRSRKLLRMRAADAET